MEQLPDVIIVYGPPLAGKGTQGFFLRKLLPEYFHLDFGTQLRAFVENNKESEQAINKRRALRIHEAMGRGEAVLTKDLRYVVEESITTAIKEGQKLLIEGPGRLLEEARWLSKFIASQNQTVAIFHLHINLQEMVKRSHHRWYCPEIDYPFRTQKAALQHCTKGEIYQRQEDIDPTINMNRYETLYNSQYAAILQTYQLNAKCDVLTLDASDESREVSLTIHKYLTKFYNLDRPMPRKTTM